MQDNIIDIITLIVATGGLAISGFALTISIKNRRNVLRENIHKRELDTMQEIITLMDEVPDSLSNWVTKIQFNHEERELNKARNNYHNHILKIMSAKNRGALFYPKSLDDNFSELTKNLLLVYNKGIYLNKEDTSIVTKACQKFQNDVRKHMKLEELSYENISLIKDKKK